MKLVLYLNLLLLSNLTACNSNMVSSQELSKCEKKLWGWQQEAIKNQTFWETGIETNV